MMLFKKLLFLRQPILLAVVFLVGTLAVSEVAALSLASHFNAGASSSAELQPVSLIAENYAQTSVFPKEKPEKEALPSAVQVDGEAKIKLLGNDAYFTDLLDSIRQAKKTIIISMFLFKTSEFRTNRGNIIMNALCEAAERGLEVRLYLESGKDESGDVTLENKKSADKLMRRGVTVRFDKKDVITHTKLVVVDEKTVYIGSHNLTHSALKYNNELSVRIDSVFFARNALAYLEDIK